MELEEREPDFPVHQRLRAGPLIGGAPDQRVDGLLHQVVRSTWARIDELPSSTQPFVPFSNTTH